MEALSVSDLPSVRGSYRQNVSLANTTWFQVGGCAHIMFRPADAQDLATFFSQLDENVPVTVIGVGSNLLVRDGGIDGVVIRLGRGFTDISVQGDEVHAGAGALGFNVATMAADAGCTGVEFLSGIPGTIGGALAMNAGAYDSDTASVLVHAEAVDEAGSIHTLYPEDIGYIYRGNTLPEGMIFTKGVFKTQASSQEDIAKRMNQIAAMRQDTQPIKSRTSGSTFKNPTDKKAWQLIDEAGCRGLAIGGAQVSEKHCNFLLNTGNATASDIEMLGEEVRQRVHDTSGVWLEWEIKIIGNT